MNPAAVRASYPQMPAFVELVDRYDPNGTFRNAFINRYVFGEG